MKENKDIQILDELSKGCAMGMDALKNILNKVEDKKLIKLLEKQYKLYESLIQDIKNYYLKFTNVK